MKIERVNDNLLRCTMTREELLYTYDVDIDLSPKEFSEVLYEHIYDIIDDCFEQENIDKEEEPLRAANLFISQDRKYVAFDFTIGHPKPQPMQSSQPSVLGGLLGFLAQAILAGGGIENEEVEIGVEHEHQEETDNSSETKDVSEEIPKEEKDYAFSFNNLQDVSDFAKIVHKNCEVSWSKLFKIDDVLYLCIRSSSNLYTLASEYIVDVSDKDVELVIDAGNALIEENAIENLLKI